MDLPTAKSAGRFRIGNLEVNRLGFGAMRIAGPGVWGEPEDRQEAMRVLRRLRDLDVDLIDTADSYGPGVSEGLIRETLHPYEGMVVATKGGMTRQGPMLYAPVGRPEYLRQCVMMSLRQLAVECLDLWYLHRIDPKVPRDEQFDALRQFRNEGLIRNIGLSQVNIEEIETASAYFPVAAVQNSFNLIDRSSEAVLDYCSSRGIAFVPFFPLAAGGLSASGSILQIIAERKRASLGQVALAWALKRSECMLPIPGTSKVTHLEQNVAGAGIRLTEDEFTALDEWGKGHQANVGNSLIRT